jgi:hypothetical protein
MEILILIMKKPFIANKVIRRNTQLIHASALFKLYKVK